MSTLSGVSSKGEKSKGKSSFQSLKINSLYKGESTEINQHKSIVPRKNGLQPLGKVIRNVRNPVNLPSEKSESSHESTINLVPIGGAGWGNKQTTEKSLVVAGKEVPPTSTAPTTSQPSQSGPVTGQQHVSSHPTSVQVSTTTTRTFHADGKTWAKKIVDIPVAAPTYLVHRSMQFQQEFPSLTSSGEHKNVINTNTPLQANAEQRPSLRPQTETSWMQGGSRPQMPQGVSSVPGVAGQSLHSQISSGTENVNGVRSSSVQNGVAGVQVGLNPYYMQYNITKNPVMRNMLPTFMVSNQSDSVLPHHPKQHIYPSEKMSHHVLSSSMVNDGALNKPSADIKELIPPPIIREEDLKRMNELSKEAGWSIQGEIDYNKKLDFSDDEDDKLNKQTLNGDIRNKSDSSKGYYNNKIPNCDSNLVQNLKENMFVPMNINGIPYSADFMHYYRQSSHQEERQIDDDYDDESLGRARVNEELNTALQRAKDRKLEEMKRFEMQLEAAKLKKNDGENNDNKDKEFKDDSPKSRSELLKDKNIEANDNKYLSLRLQKQFEQNNDIANKAQHISSKGARTLCRTDSDMSSSGYSEYRSDSWIEDDHQNKSSQKRDKRPEFDRYRREKPRSDPKEKSDKYGHNDYSRTDDNRKTYDHKRDFKRNDSGGNLKKSSDDNYEADRNDKKDSFSKISKYHSRDSLENPDEVEKENMQGDDESYSWGQKSLGKDFYKDDINAGQFSKKHIPGPITQEKLEACELTSEPKRNLNQLVKSERKDSKKNDGDDLSCKAKTGVWDLAPTNKNKMLQEQNQSKLDQDSKIGKTGQKNEDDNKLSEPKSSLENSSGTSSLSHLKGMRSDRNVGSRSYHQDINSRTVSRSGSNRKSTWPESYEEGHRSRGPPRRDDRNRGEDRNRNEDRNRGEDRNRNDDRNRGDDRNRNDDRNRGSNRQNDRFSDKSSLRSYGQRSEQRGRGRLGNIDSRIINGRTGAKISVDENVEKNKLNLNSGSTRRKESSTKIQSKLDSYSGEMSRRGGESRFGSRQNNRTSNTQKQEDNWESVSEPSDYEAQQKSSNRRLSSRTYLASSRGEKRSNYDKKEQSKESSNNEKPSLKSSSSTSANDSKSYGGSNSQDGRINKKDDQRKSNDSLQKNQRLTNQNNRKDTSKLSSRSNQNSNSAKPGQTNQRYERQKSQPQIGQDDSSTPIIKDAVVMVSNNPPPPPQTNAWDKPITHALRAQSPNVNKPQNPQTNNRSNSLNEIKEITGQTSQRLSSNKEKGSPNVMENGILDSSQRMETIIFENTTYKSKPCGESKSKYNSNMKQRNDKDSCNFNEDAQDTCFRAFKSSNTDGKDSKLNEAVQMSMSFKNDESSDLNLGFGDFDSDFTRNGGHLSAENKDVMTMTSQSRSMHTGPSSLAASDLKTMIAGTKKVWDDKPESNQQVQQNIAENAFNTVYSTANTGQHDKSEISVIDEQRVHNQQVYSPAPQLQNVAGSYIPVSMAAAGQLKQDPNASTTNVCKVKPQPQGTLSPPLSQQQQSSTSTHAFSSTTPQPHTSTTPLANTIPTQATHMNLQIMMENSDGLPDMYGAHILKQQQTHLILNTNNKNGVEMLAKQYVSAAPGPSPTSAILFNSAQQHLMPPPSPSAPQVYQTMLEPSQTVISNATRSQYNQFTYGLQSNGLNQNSQFNPSMFIHATTPAGQAGSEVFQSSISPFRLGPAYNNGQQINTNLNPVLIPSSTNSSSSQVKQSSQQIGTIGNKTTYNATTPQPSPFMVQYDPTTMFNQPFNSINNARATPLQSSSSLYSTNSATGPTNPGYIPNVASAFQAQVVAGASGGNTFGIPTYGSQNPPPNMQNYTSQFRQVPYMKNNLSGGNGANDLQKSGISNQQDLGNPMFSTNLFRQQPFFDANKPLMNSNQQTHQAMQGKYSNYQVSASQNNQMPLMQQPRMNMNNSNSGSIAGNIAPQYPSPIQRPTFQHIQRMPPPQNMRMQPNCAPMQHLMNKNQTSNNYFVSNAGLIVEPSLPISNKIDNANVNVDTKVEEKIDNTSKPQSTECKDDKTLAAND